MKLLVPLIIVVALASLSWPMPRAAGQSVAEARAKIDALSVDQREKLRHRWEEFRELPAEERSRIRALHHHLETDPDGAELRGVADRYATWLKQLPPLTRSELQSLPADKRIERIRKIMKQQEASALKELDESEAEIVRQWLSEHADRLIARLPDPIRHRLMRIEDARGRRFALIMMWNAPQSRHDFRRLLREEDLAPLRQALPADVSGAMKDLPTEQQWRLVEGWIRQLVQHRWRQGRDASGFGTRGEEQLLELFESGLSDEQVDRLVNMPPDQMRGELLRLYMERRGVGPRGGSGRRGRGPPFGPSEGARGPRHGEPWHADPRRSTPDRRGPPPGTDPSGSRRGNRRQGTPAPADSPDGLPPPRPGAGRPG